MRLFSLGTMYLFCSLALSSCCGYSILTSPHKLSSLGQSLSHAGIFIAPIKEDHHGQLTSALIYEFSKRSLPISGRNSCAGYTLKIELVNPIDENIGFTYAPNKPGDKTQRHFIVSNEGRLSLSAKIQLINNHTGEVLLDQCVSRESVDFDFEPDLGITNTHEFALGQLEMHNEAIKSARRILSVRLAEMIVQQVYYDLF
ncbi:hypothetical protein C10C_0634 [Chlamydia serpentis]|uniref:Lipopolysaccharide-assembly family protein n=1 Tax=Chlamydia serpentis TaxID=1967782 RepID=A0A2R8FBK7_9CHLA|nr:LPS assembly lipoprotein LptE [Chlamydia serpentis]SPN73788.1 hypothetical protein C10C_0634 [Chlamydia serpentis]